MSEYLQCNTRFRDCDSLLAALTEVGRANGQPWARDQIEVHETPQTLYGYRGDARPEKAHVIIRRQSIGGGSNDLGFVRQEDGTYQAIISEWDRNSLGYDEQWLGRLAQRYNLHFLQRHFGRRKMPIKTTRKQNGGIRLEIQVR